MTHGGEGGREFGAPTVGHVASSTRSEEPAGAVSGEMKGEAFGAGGGVFEQRFQRVEPTQKRRGEDRLTVRRSRFRVSPGVVKICEIGAVLLAREELEPGFAVKVWCPLAGVSGAIVGLEPRFQRQRQTEQNPPDIGLQRAKALAEPRGGGLADLHGRELQIIPRDNPGDEQFALGLQMHERISRERHAQKDAMDANSVGLKCQIPASKPSLQLICDKFETSRPR